VESNQLSNLVAQARAASNNGQWGEAELLWTEVTNLDPNHFQARYSLGVMAHSRGDLKVALRHLQSAHELSPTDPMIPLTVSVVQRQAGNAEAEWAGIQAALSLDPYFLPGLLAKGEYLERTDGLQAAAPVFRNALKVAPVEPQWPDALRRRLTHAREVVERDARELSEFLTAQVSSLRSNLSPSTRARWDEAVEIAAGRSRPYRSECKELYVPRLPALTFYDRALFSWIEALESRTDEIREELRQVLSSPGEDLVPYIAFGADDPVNQWQALNHSRDWSSFHLWAHGKPVEANLSRCPRTAEALASVDAARMAGLCPNAMFSILAPHTHIPPHTGETNARLVAHLPLIVPQGCSFRVGFDTVEWQEGQVIVFDDTLEHEARNDSDEPRVVLIFDVWNPLLSTAERELASALASSTQAFRNTRQA